MQRVDARERVLSNELSGGKEGNCGFPAPLRDYGDLRSAALQIEHELRVFALTEEIFLGI